MPKVSICIPTYKQIEYLTRTLDSIILQTYKDYEVIITDDTPDNSVAEFIQPYIYKFNGKLKYYKNAKSLGSPENWNEAIKHSVGEYIKMLHHDDWFTYENSLELYVKLMKDNPDAILGFSNSLVYFANSGTTKVHKPNNEQLFELAKNVNHLFWSNIIGAPSAVIYKRESSIKYDIHLKWLVDLDFYMRLLNKNKKFAYINKDLITTVTEASHSVTSHSSNNKYIEVPENFYVFLKFKSSIPIREVTRYYSYLFKILQKFDTLTIAQIRETGYRGPISLRFKLFLLIQKISLRMFAYLAK